MSSPYEQNRRRGVWSHWVPLAVTVTVATVGLAAWVWNQRRDDEHEDPDLVYHDTDYEHADYGENPNYGAASTRGIGNGHGDRGYGGAGGTPGHEPAPSEGVASGAGWGSHMSGALRRTPSPQQFFDSARKTVAAGVTAAGAVMGSALSAIREEDKNAYADHETWSEEADAKINKEQEKQRGQPRSSRKKRKVVAVIVSAENHPDDVDLDGYHEHASILSHIPRQTDFSAIRLFVLIYAPGALKEASLDASNNPQSASLSSSFENIEHSQTPGDEGKSPLMSASKTDPAFNAIYLQATTLVEKESMVLPFTTPNGHVHILRHLKPDIVYLQEALAGENGSAVAQLQTWLRHDIVLVVGADGGHGGLADSESETERPDKPQEWWRREDRVGRGRGVIVVDGMRVHDDWNRRVLSLES